MIKSSENMNEQRNAILPEYGMSKSSEVGIPKTSEKSAFTGIP